MNIILDEQEERKRRNLSRWFTVLIVVTTVFVMGGGGLFRDNEVTEIFRGLLTENIPAELIYPANEYLESFGFDPLPVLKFTSKVNVSESRLVVLGGAGEETYYYDKAGAPRDPGSRPLKRIAWVAEPEKRRGKPEDAAPYKFIHYVAEINDPISKPVGEPEDVDPFKFVRYVPGVGNPLSKPGRGSQPQAQARTPIPSETPLPTATLPATETPPATATLLPSTTETSVPTQTSSPIPTSTLLPLWTKTPTPVPRVAERLGDEDGPPPAGGGGVGVVTTGNNAPSAGADSTVTKVNTPITVIVQSNDSDADGDTLTTTGASNGSNGTVSLSGNNVTYTPDPGFTGNDSFTYTIDDGNGGTASGTVDVTVNP